jgi:hypothetical protein
MFTQTLHTALVLWAGPDFMWTNGPLGKTGAPLLGTRPKNVTRHGLRDVLYGAQHGLCAFCGEHVPYAETEMCHIVATGPQDDGTGSRIRRGWVPGNIAIGCHADNERHAEVFGPIVPLSAIARPDLILTSWPGETALRAIGANAARRIA